MFKDSDIIFNSISDPIMTLDLNNEILEANNAAVSASKLQYKELIGKKCYKVFHCSDHPPADCPNEKLKKSQKPETKDMVVECLSATCIVSVAPIFNTQGEMIKSVHIAHDITERKKMESLLKTRTVALDNEISAHKKAEKRLIELSFKDELTGLYNRRGFFSLTEQQLKIARRKKEKIFLLYYDLDKLKEINDIFDHKEGDEALKVIAMISKSSCRESDIVARFGGDEFLIFGIGHDDESNKLVVDRLLENIDIQNRESKKGYKLLISIGMVSCDPRDICSISELITNADNLMYKEKKKKHAASLKLTDGTPL